MEQWNPRNPSWPASEGQAEQHWSTIRTVQIPEERESLRVGLELIGNRVVSIGRHVVSHILRASSPISSTHESTLVDSDTMFYMKMTRNCDDA